MPSLLFLTPQSPYPPRQGTAIRNWGLLAGLARSHPVDLLTFDSNPANVHAMLRAVCRHVEIVPTPRRGTAARLGTLLTSRQPDLAQRLYSPDFAAHLGEMLRKAPPDIVHVEGLEMAGYVPVIREQAPNARIVYDAHNAETVIQRRAFQTDIRQPRRWAAAVYSQMQAGRLARYEREVVQRADHVLCVSTEDAAVLRELAGVDPVVVPNGLSLSDYQGVIPAKFEQPAMVFTGKMDYRPNVDAVDWFARQIFPPIRDAYPQAQFIIAGQRPTPAVTALTRQPGVTVTGAVQVMQPYVAAAAVYVAPLRMGGGTRFKLLEAMALRRAIVSTAIGAEGFEIEDGRELVLADTAKAFTQAVLGLLGDPPRRMALGNAGYEFVSASYDWLSIIPKVEAVYG